MNHLPSAGATLQKLQSHPNKKLQDVLFQSKAEVDFSVLGHRERQDRCFGLRRGRLLGDFNHGRVELILGAKSPAVVSLDAEL